MRAMRNTQELTLTFGERLAKARRLAGMTQTQMAVRLGIGRRSLVRYEDDTMTPNQAICIAWSVVTDVPTEWLETGAVTDPNSHGQFRPWDLPPAASALAA